MFSISIITICYNNLQELIETCNSVDMQSRKPFEHLIVDGSTNIQIKDYLEQHPQPLYRKWINERDNGISDAFNKGILNTGGDIIVMLNSGDAFFDTHSIEIATKKFEENPSLQWLHGKYKIFRGNIWVIIGKPFERKKLYRGMRSICHQSMFVKRRLYNKYGLYNTAERIAMDYDFLCRIADEPFSFLEHPLVIFQPSGVSGVNYLESLRHARGIYEKYFGRSIILSLWQMRLRILFYLLKSPIGNLLYKIKTKFGLENM